MGCIVPALLGFSFESLSDFDFYAWVSGMCAQNQNWLFLPSGSCQMAIQHTLLCLKLR